MKYAIRLASALKLKISADKLSILLVGVLIILAGANVLAQNNSKVKNRVTENGYTPDKNSELWKYIDGLTIIDTHEHISSEAELLGAQIDIFHLFVPYIVDNLESAGIRNDEMALMKNEKAAFKDRWAVFNKYYPSIRNTTYVLALQTALEKQYQFQNFGLEECTRVSELMKKDFAEKGFMKKFMDFNKIESILTFRSPTLAEARRNYGDKIMLVPTMNELCVRDAQSLETISLATEMPIRNLDDILAGIDKLFKEYNERGIKNIKFGSAYNRVLNYKARTRQEADASFAKIMATPFDYSNVVPNKYYVYTLSDYHMPLDDYLAAYMIGLAGKYKMNVIFHVGLAAWNFNSAENSHASNLEWLIRAFPQVNFVILHCGYPFFDEAVLLAKYYPNVYLNMTWDHIIERGKSVQLVKTFIEMLPTNKIHAFGGDYLFPQQIYGDVIFTKENLYKAFSELIQEGLLTTDQTKQIVYDWLYANPKAFYYR